MPKRSKIWKSAEVAFTAVLPEIRTGLHEGRTVVYLHEVFKDRLEISYPQFARYVRKYRALELGTNFAVSASVVNGQNTSPTTPPPSQATERKVPGAGFAQKKQTGFYFDPTDIDKKKLV